MVSLCWDNGQWSKGHPCNMDGAGGSWTHQYMHGIDHERGTWVGAIEACKSRWLSDRGQESLVSIVVYGLDYIWCECKSRVSYMPNTYKMMCLLGGGSKLCLSWGRHMWQLYDEIIKWCSFLEMVRDPTWVAVKKCDTSTGPETLTSQCGM